MTDSSEAYSPMRSLDLTGLLEAAGDEAERQASLSFHRARKSRTALAGQTPWTAASKEEPDPS